MSSLKVFVAGQNEYIEPLNQIESTMANELQIPFPVTDFFAGGMHLLFLVNGEVYSMGTGDNGPMGLGKNNTDSEIPQKINNLSNIIQVVAGDNFSCFLSSDNKIMASGMFDADQSKIFLPSCSDSVFTPIPLPPLPRNKNISKITARDTAINILTTNGEVYFLGVSRERITLKPQRIISYCTDIWSGGHQTFALRRTSSSFKLFAWGLNNWGQLGLGKGKPVIVSEPMEVALPFSSQDNDVIDIEIATGSFHTLLLVKRKNQISNLFAVGKNLDGQCGQNQVSEIIFSWKPVYLPDNDKSETILHIGCNMEYSYAITNQKVYSWGSHVNNMTTHTPLTNLTNDSKSNTDIISPLPIHFSLSQSINQYQCIKVSCGGTNVLFLVELYEGIPRKKRRLE